MLEVFERLGTDFVAPHARKVVLSYQQRNRWRLRTYLSDGEELRLFLKRGAPLQVGECLRSDCGQYIVVEGAMEPVVTAHTDDWEIFSQACYHLGNRHAKVQLGPRWLRISPDHVLEEMLSMLGMQLECSEHLFIPVSGAYTSGGHKHGGHEHGDHEQDDLEQEKIHAQAHGHHSHEHH